MLIKLYKVMSPFRLIELINLPFSQGIQKSQKICFCIYNQKVNDIFLFHFPFLFQEQES